jgi:hypothetical protein
VICPFESYAKLIKLAVRLHLLNLLAQGRQLTEHGKGVGLPSPTLPASLSCVPSKSSSSWLEASLMYSSSESMVCGIGESTSVSGVVGVSSCGAASSSFLLALESVMALSSKVLGAFLFLV